jgi:hypothetical protein
MVSILLTVSRIATHGLKVTFLDLTNPDICPSRRNRQRANPREGCLGADQPPIRSKISKGFAGADAPNAGHAVGHIPQAGELGCGDGVCRYKAHINLYGTSKTSARRLSKTGEIMDTLLIVAIVLIALAVIAQTAVLVAMYLMSRRITTKAESLMSESQNVMRLVESVTSNLKAVSQDLTETGKIARGQVLNIQDCINETRDTIRGQMVEVREVVLDTADEARDLVLRPVRHFSALAMGIAVGIRTFLFGRRRTVTDEERPAA